MSTLLLDSPDVATFRRTPRYTPYRDSIVRFFAEATPDERNMYRWLYREFRTQKHSTTMSARALVFTFVLRTERIENLKGGR